VWTATAGWQEVSAEEDASYLTAIQLYTYFAQYTGDNYRGADGHDIQIHGLRLDWPNGVLSNYTEFGLELAGRYWNVLRAAGGTANGYNYAFLPSEAPLIQDDFSSDTSGDWSLGEGVNDGTLAVTGGALVFTTGANDFNFPRVTTQITGLEVGREYWLVGTLGGTTSHKAMTIGEQANGGGSHAGAGAGTGRIRVIFTATAETMYVGLQCAKDGSAGTTITLDDVVIVVQFVQVLEYTDLDVAAIINWVRADANAGLSQSDTSYWVRGVQSWLEPRAGAGRVDINGLSTSVIP
jgi:hypothetical protein